MSNTKPLRHKKAALEALEAVMKLHDLSATAVGMRQFGSATFVQRLRDDQKDIMTSSLDLIWDFVEEWNKIVPGQGELFPTKAGD